MEEVLQDLLHISLTKVYEDSPKAGLDITAHRFSEVFGRSLISKPAREGKVLLMIYMNVKSVLHAESVNYRQDRWDIPFGPHEPCILLRGMRSLQSTIGCLFDHTRRCSALVIIASP